MVETILIPASVPVPSNIPPSTPCNFQAGRYIVGSNVVKNNIFIEDIRPWIPAGLTHLQLRDHLKEKYSLMYAFYLNRIATESDLLAWTADFETQNTRYEIFNPADSVWPWFIVKSGDFREAIYNEAKYWCDNFAVKYLNRHGTDTENNKYATLIQAQGYAKTEKQFKTDFNIQIPYIENMITLAFPKYLGRYGESNIIPLWVNYCIQNGGDVFWTAFKNEYTPELKSFVYSQIFNYYDISDTKMQWYIDKCFDTDYNTMSGLLSSDSTALLSLRGTINDSYKYFLNREAFDSEKRYWLKQAGENGIVFNTVFVQYLLDSNNTETTLLIQHLLNTYLLSTGQDNINKYKTYLSQNGYTITTQAMYNESAGITPPVVTPPVVTPPADNGDVTPPVNTGGTVTTPVVTEPPQAASPVPAIAIIGLILSQIGS